MGANPRSPSAPPRTLIRVQGARVNNLKDLHVEIPKRRRAVETPPQPVRRLLRAVTR
jgi:hypothetical protein